MCQRTLTSTDRLVASMQREQAEMQRLGHRIEQRLAHLDAELSKHEAVASCYQLDGESELSQEEIETRRANYEMAWL